MARLTNTSNNIPILNQALQDIAALKAQVAILQTSPPLKLYTPNVTALTGAFTTVQAQGWYTQVGAQILLLLQINIVAVGSGSEPIVSLPIAASQKLKQILPGREDQITGNEMQFIIPPGKNWGVLFTYNNGTSVASGYKYIVTGTYLVDL